MGAISSSCGAEGLQSQAKDATKRPFNDVGAAAPDLDEQVAQVREEKDSRLHARAFEAALVENHVALHRFIGEWIESQEQLLLRKTKAVTDCYFASNGHASSESLTRLVVDGSQDLPRRGVETADPCFDGLPQLMANHEIFAVPAGPDDIAEQSEQKRCDVGAHCEPTSDLRQADIRAVPVGTEDMPKESLQNSYVGDESPEGTKLKLREVRPKLVQVRPSLIDRLTRSKTLHQGTLSSISFKSVSDFWDSISAVFKNANNMVNQHCDWPLINRIDSSRIFSILSGLVIFLNAISMAVAADYEMKHFQLPENESFSRIEAVFVVLYTVELVIRILAQRLMFFMSGWSWFDVAIICSGWIEITSSTSTSLGQLRLLRILKMLKVMRVLRVMRSLREVRLLLNSLMGSVKPLFWTIIMSTGVNFMFGICFVQSIAGFRHDIWKHGDEDVDLEQLEMIYSSWGSVLQAMYMLFKVSTGGASWGDQSDPMLHNMGWQTFAIFLIYIAFFLFVMTNAVTAIFVSSVEEYASKDLHSMMYDQFQARGEYMKQVIPLFQDMDRDSNGEVTKAEFGKYMYDPRMIAFANNLDIDTVYLEEFFEVLSAGGNLKVDLNTFLDGCIRLRGNARSMDVYEMLIHQRALEKDVGRIRSLLERLRLK